MDWIEYIKQIKNIYNIYDFLAVCWPNGDGSDLILNSTDSLTLKFKFDCKYKLDFEPSQLDSEHDLHHESHINSWFDLSLIFIS